MRRMLLRSCLGLSLLALALTGRPALRADEWRAVGTTSSPSSPRPVQPAQSAASARWAGLGAPITAKSSGTSDSAPAFQTSFSSPAVKGVKVRGQSPDGGFVPGSPEEQYNCGVVTEGPPAGGHGLFQGSGGGFWDNLCGRPCAFQSDHDFDGFASPVSNPFFFEDPRSLTEIKPIFIWQKIPDGNPQFQGGNAEFFGLQARLALTERWSFVLHKIGGVWIQPDAPFFGDEGGRSEIQLGPKFTFYRDPGTQTIAAIGLNFELATGSGSVFQDTGDGAITPYISAGQKLGNFHLLGSFGYRFRFDDARSNSFFTSLHLDYNLWDKLYPLVELNWYHYTRNGSSRVADFEGADLFNFGSNDVEGNDVVTLAAGVRFKINEAIQAGIVAEFPVLKREDLLDFRITADIIFRY